MLLAPATLHLASRNRRMDCDVCGMELSARSLPGHLETRHGVFRSRVPDRDLVLDDRESQPLTTPSRVPDDPIH